MKWMADVNSKRLGIKTGYIVLMVLFLGIFSVTAWGAPGDYEGSYSGTYSGDDNGIFIAYVDNTGFMRFITWSSDYETVDGGDQTVGTNGEIDLLTDDFTHVTGNIALVSGVSGIWVNAPDSGTFSGTEQNPTHVDDYAGSYSGEYCGDDSGTWDITVASTGYVSGSVDTSSGGIVSLEGGVNAVGDFIIFAYGDNAAVRGTISSGNVTGYWRSEEDGLSGYISNTGTCGPITSALGDGGGGGCFISTLFK